ncbi:MAG: helix-turn-helix transcriptional regulator [Flavobacteriales bacterium]|nr:helix-turn-helix transcriptional regulator [Flavobacteriales bacterium]
MKKKELVLKIGLNIRRIRIDKKLSQADLAYRCDKNQQHIELIENGKIVCTVHTLFLIINSLKCTPNELFEGIEFKT